MSYASSEASYTPRVDSPVASIVGKWKDAHREKQAAVLRMPDSPLRRSRSSSGITDDSATTLQQCSQTISWMAQTMMEDRHQTKEWQIKIENLLKHSDVDRVLSANAEHIQCLVQDGIKEQRLWLTERFNKLVMLDEKHQEAVRAIPQILQRGLPPEQLKPSQGFSGAGSDANEPLLPADNSVSLTHRVGPKHIPSQTYTAPKVDSTAGSDTMAEPSSHDLEPGMPDRQKQTSAHSKLVLAPSKITTHRSGAGAEAERMMGYLERMRAANTQSSIASLIKHCLRISDQRWKNMHKKPNNCMINIVESYWFATVSLTAVILNGIWIGYQTEASMSFLTDPEGQQASWHQDVSRVFSVIFAIEIVLRLGTYRFFFFICKDRAWNLYDLLVVIVALVEELFSTLNLKFLRTLRVIRLVRVTRVIRLLRFFQGIRYLLCTLTACAGMLFWTVVFLGFLIYMFAIVFMQGVAIWIDREDTVLMHKIEQYYGSLATTMFTLMMVVAGGQPWKTFVDPLGDVNAILVPAFLVYVVISLYGILNIVAAVFVQRAIELRQRDRDLAVHKEIEDTEAFAFHLMEYFEDEGLSPDDMMEWPTCQSVLARKDVQMFLQTHGIDVSEAEELFSLIDVTHSSEIPVEDFVYGCQRLKGFAKGMDLVLLHDQVLQTKGHLKFIEDKQNSLQHQVSIFKSHLSGELSSAVSVMKEVSADLYVSSHKLKTWSADESRTFSDGELRTL